MVIRGRASLSGSRFGLWKAGWRLVVRGIFTFSSAKPIPILLFFAGLSAGAPSGHCASAIQPPDIKRILDRGKLIVAMYSEDTPPFYMADKNGNLTGFDVHLIRGFAGQLGVTVEFRRNNKTFEDIIGAVTRRDVDVAISKLSMTFPRAARLLFSDPYMKVWQSLLINRLGLARLQKGNRLSVTEILQNLRSPIGVIGESSYVTYASEQFRTAPLKTYPTWEKTIAALDSGEILAAYWDEIATKTVINDKPERALNFLTVILKDAIDPKGIAVPWDSRHLASLINNYLSSLNLEMTANKLLNDYERIIHLIDAKTKR